LSAKVVLRRQAAGFSLVEAAPVYSRTWTRKGGRLRARPRRDAL